MRLLVFSDVHANATALEAALQACAGRWERAVCLGDIVGYGPDPNEVVERVRSLVSAIVRGNHDKAVSGISDLEDFNPVARAAVEWTRGQLRPENLRYLRNLPAGPLDTDGGVLVHGALEDEDEYVFAAEQALPGLVASPRPVTFFGHTHIQGGFSYDGARTDRIESRPGLGTSSVTVSLEPKTRYLLNPGSVGQPRDGDPRAAFAIADLEKRRVEFWRVPYDIAAVQDRMEQAGAPQALVLRLAFGR
jgi:diadenosine tetraphosphatase ApaH/serine/threonine PP2A family protein phosphatase